MKRRTKLGVAVACLLSPATFAEPAPYLDAASFEARFSADAPLASCPLGVLDLLLVVSVEVGRDGALTGATVGGAPDPIAACLEAALLAWRLPPQREPGQRVSFTLPVRAGQPLEPQGLRAPMPVDAPVLVRLPPTLSPDARAALAPLVSPIRSAVEPATSAASPPASPPPSAE